jgi:formylglycine-generating enzyme required for sulfatase activity/serine/threonine protein kinase
MAADQGARNVTLEQRAREARVAEFEQNWHPRALAEAVARFGNMPPDQRQSLLAQLVRVDLQQQWRRGQRVLLETYLSDYPQLGTAATIPAELIHAECVARRQAGLGVDLAEVSRRFPAQADAVERLWVESERNAAWPPLRPMVRDTSRTDRTTAGPTRQPIPSDALPVEFGRYRILRRLGGGGMGTVYLAHDSQLDREIALKVPHFSANDGPQIIERFYREARLAATLRHPNICPVYDVGEIHGVHYLSMAYIDGRLLKEFIRPEKPLAEKQVVAVVRKLALTLQDAHERGVIHRDLKPSNIMIDERREPIIMDFGLARRSQEDQHLTKTGAVLGTLAYMSPEQLLGSPDAIGPQSDVYSLGVVLYELLTSRPPFEGHETALIGQILTVEPPPPRTHRPGLDPALEAICLRAMAKKPEIRYASMKDFAAALTNWQHQSVTTLTTRSTNLPAAAPTTAGNHPDAAPGEATGLLGAPTVSPLASAPTVHTKTKQTERPAWQRWWHNLPRSRRVSGVIFVSVLSVFLILLGIIIKLSTPQQALPHGTLVVSLFGFGEEGALEGMLVEVVDVQGNIRQTQKASSEPMRFSVDMDAGLLRVRKGETVVSWREFRLTDGDEQNVLVDGKWLWDLNASAVPAVAPATTTPPVSPPPVPAAAPAPAAVTPVAGPAPALAIAPFDTVKAKEHQSKWATYLKLPVEITDSVGIRMVLIPPGEFQMGSGSAESGVDGDEKPQHLVRITRPFYLSATEITQQQYEQVAWVNRSQFQVDRNRPVEMVSWNDAAEFCRKLGDLPQEKSAGALYRLPTEAEWEYSCRAGTTSLHNFGDNSNQLRERAWCDGNSAMQTHPVGQFPPNAWGLYDMHGNVWEWCQDWYDSGYYRQSPTGDPMGTDTGTSRVLRGGSWGNINPYCFRSAYRSAGGPDGRCDNVGIRVVRTVGP